MSLAWSGRYFYVGCEDTGVWQYDWQAPEKDRWRQFTTKDGLGDDSAYAMVVDRRDRLWVGNLNHGVSVYNGLEWRNYNLLTGPSGVHVFAMATSPVDGDVWISTEAGLTRYSLSGDTWSDVARTDSLPHDPPSTLAFDPSTGDLYVGTQCSGVAIGSRASDYRSWRAVHGPGPMPVTPGGAGLPTDLINCLLVSKKSGTVYAGTPTGLARSESRGKDWRYLRGADWRAKVLGLYHGPKPVEVQTRGHILPEAYVTALGEDSAGRLWIGFRQQGIEVVDPATGEEVAKFGDNFVTALLPGPGGVVLVGCYGGGLALESVRAASGGPPDMGPAAAGAATTSQAPVRAEPPTPPISAPAMPAPARPPTLARLQDLLAAADQVDERPAASGSAVRAMCDDWLTEGTWITRYGAVYGCLCAMYAPRNTIVGQFAQDVDLRTWMGRTHAEGDVYRNWIQDVHTAEPRALQNPRGGRRMASWDDHGEASLMTMQGPSLYATLKMKPGDYILSVYCVNQDSHSPFPGNRWRDYLVDVKPTPMPDGRFARLGADRLGRPTFEEEQLFNDSPGGARTRAVWTWGGVYKRFYVRIASGQPYITVRIDRNCSFNTIVSGVFVDRVGEPRGPAGPSGPPSHPVSRRPLFRGANRPVSMADVCLHLLDRLLSLRDSDPAWSAANSRLYLLPLVRRFFAPDSAGVTELRGRRGYYVSKTFVYLRQGEREPRLGDRVEAENIYPSLRKDVAACLNDLQLFDLRDQLWFGGDRSDMAEWEERTRIAEASGWDPQKMAQLSHTEPESPANFLERHRAKATWSEVEGSVPPDK